MELLYQLDLGWPVDTGVVSRYNTTRLLLFNSNGDEMRPGIIPVESD